MASSRGNVVSARIYGVWPELVKGHIPDQGDNSIEPSHDLRSRVLGHGAENDVTTSDLVVKSPQTGTQLFRTLVQDVIRVENGAEDRVREKSLQLLIVRLDAEIQIQNVGDFGIGSRRAKNSETKLGSWSQS